MIAISLAVKSLGSNILHGSINLVHQNYRELELSSLLNESKHSPITITQIKLNHPKNIRGYIKQSYYSELHNVVRCLVRLQFDNFLHAKVENLSTIQTNFVCEVYIYLRSPSGTCSRSFEQHMDTTIDNNTHATQEEQDCVKYLLDQGWLEMLRDMIKDNSSISQHSSLNFPRLIVANLIDRGVIRHPTVNVLNTNTCYFSVDSSTPSPHDHEIEVLGKLQEYAETANPHMDELAMLAKAQKRQNIVDQNVDPVSNYLLHLHNHYTENNNAMNEEIVRLDNKDPFENENRVLDTQRSHIKTFSYQLLDHEAALKKRCEMFSNAEWKFKCPKELAVTGFYPTGISNYFFKKY